MNSSRLSHVSLFFYFFDLTCPLPSCLTSCSSSEDPITGISSCYITVWLLFTNVPTWSWHSVSQVQHRRDLWNLKAHAPSFALTEGQRSSLLDVDHYLSQRHELDWIGVKRGEEAKSMIFLLDFWAQSWLIQRSNSRLCVIIGVTPINIVVKKVCSQMHLRSGVLIRWEKSPFDQR